MNKLGQHELWNMLNNTNFGGIFNIIFAHFLTCKVPILHEKVQQISCKGKQASLRECREFSQQEYQFINGQAVR